MVCSRSKENSVQIDAHFALMRVCACVCAPKLSELVTGHGRRALGVLRGLLACTAYTCTYGTYLHVYALPASEFTTIWHARPLAATAECGSAPQFVARHGQRLMVDQRRVACLNGRGSRVFSLKLEKVVASKGCELAKVQSPFFRSY